MKIVLIGTAYPFRGGLAAYNERLAKELIEQGHSVTIYTFTLQYPQLLFPGKTQYSTEPAPKDINIVRKVNSINPLNWWSVGNEIKSLKPDLVLVKYWIPFMALCFGTILRKVKKNKHTQVIALIDNMIPHEKRLGDSILTNYFIKPIDAYIAMSKVVQADILKFEKEKPIKLSPHPLFDNFGENIDRSKALEKLGLSKDYTYILFFGLIRDYKGLDLLIEALADQRLKDRKVKLIIAGEYYADRNQYLALIEKNQLQDQIIETNGFISDSDVKYYFGAADVVVQPYKTATQSGVTQIAYHFNKPMIVTNVGGLPEMCPDGKVGYVVNVDVQSLAKAIARFLDEGAEQFEASIQEEKKKYSWNVLVNSIFAVREKIDE